MCENNIAIYTKAMKHDIMQMTNHQKKSSMKVQNLETCIVSYSVIYTVSYSVT